MTRNICLQIGSSAIFSVTLSNFFIHRSRPPHIHGSISSYTTTTTTTKTSSVGVLSRDRTNSNKELGLPRFSKEVLKTEHLAEE